MAQVNIDVAKEASVQAVNTTVGAVNTSVQAVNTKVGTSGDTASSTPTTLFAGIKGLIGWFTGTWTVARAEKIDTINANVSTASNNVSTTNSNIGSTNNTGGTTTEGTVMAKLNALLTSWTSTRAGYIDTILNSVVANNTPSSTGILSQKLSYIISGITSNYPVVQSGSIEQGTSFNGIYLPSGTSAPAYTYINVTISAVNLSKTTAIPTYFNMNGYYTTLPYEFTSTTNLRIYCSSITTWNSSYGKLNCPIRWQVIQH